MDHWKERRPIVITCNKRLSPFLKQETEALGFTTARVFSTGVELEGTLADCVRINLHLRCASQVLYSLKKFRAIRPDDVYQTLSKFAWEKLIPSNGYVSVTSTVDHFTVNNNLFVNVKVKDAIADRIRAQAGERPDSGPDLDRTVIHLFWKEDHAEVFIDTSGHTLAKHGYRKIPGKAPMLEALAAATVMATKWDPKVPFINPMCGSGTLAIEAALMATGRYPGLFRKNYGFMHLVGYEQELYDAEMDRLRKEIVEVAGLQIIATDLRKDAVDTAEVNAEVAGVRDLIRFSVGDFESTEIPPPPGVIFFNPEYGERMGELSELEILYGRMGDFLKKKCQGYHGFIFTGNLDLAKKIGLHARRRTEFYNAKLDCRLLEFELYAGTRRPATPSGSPA